jgi:hypothetical protein
MKIVIQCAATKVSSAGYWRDDNNKRVNFIAQPSMAPENCGELFVRPDDIADEDKSYRDLLIAYNENGDNSFGLYKAWRLYSNPTYRKLVLAFGEENIFILSAGWGLVRSTFLLPQYDITFSHAGGKLKKRSAHDSYCDFAHIQENETDEVHFVGGKGYVPLFLDLTKSVANRILHYNSQTQPKAPGCQLKLFETTRRTNWHYDCAAALCAQSKNTI